MSRLVPAPQPDLSSRLLAAVAERDDVLASRLGQQWVHRRGLKALDRFLLTALAPSQGIEAAQWLRRRLGLIEAPVSPAFSSQVNQPHTIEEVLIDEQELAALETQMATSLELDEPERPYGPASRPAALFGRMKALLCQCLEEAIVGGEEGAEQSEPISSAPFALQSESVTTIRAAGAAEPSSILSVIQPLQASRSPAPAPASLAALRAWLPDAEEDGRDLPRAC